VDHGRMKSEVDEFFGGEDRVDSEDPWSRRRA
jgi:hypothetical protein